MKFHSLIIFLVLFTLSCNSSKKVKTSIEIKKELQGFWLMNDTIKGEMKQFNLYFNDSICHVFYNQSNLNRYKIHDSILELRITSSSPIIGNRMRFKICSVNNQMLCLLPLSKNLKESCAKDGLDTLSLHKAKARNRLNWNQVTFYSTGCFGTCQSFIFQIKKSGDMLYQGISFTEKEGNYTSKKDEEFYAILADKLKYINFRQLKSEYSAPWSDDQTVNLAVETKSNAYLTSVYGNFEEPAPLRVFFSYIFSNYERIKWNKTNEIFSFEDNENLRDLFSVYQEKSIVFLPPISQ
ncbi:DUF6438 domain-containing protein [Fluviicola taffensis]|uniref:DUF6438 domain-containing protein n=1 Tax=Fluviicola taffensis (strain DSM 16823 / NCIMB 13979 / RW262) TaxID=755732 RepID=F2IH61_FLUTR|nr:DUF6438 domain-containing protein [Fluviicola taffensis]AEA45875.1 hypothetical protein Fluta_3911 [Fluviicola taffensis DSM 16823]